MTGEGHNPTIHDVNISGKTPEQTEWVRQARERIIEPRSLSIRNIPIDFKAIAETARMVNLLKADESRITEFDIRQLRPPEAIIIVIPMVASVIANRANPAVPVDLPTVEEVKAMRPWLRDISFIIGKFSKKWQGGFNRFIEREGQQRVIFGKEVEKVGNLIDLFNNVGNPREQFVREVYQLYTGLNIDRRGISRVFDNGDEIEDKVEHFLNTMRDAREGITYDSHWFNRKTFPLLANLLPTLKFPPDSFVYDDRVPFVAAEMMAGIEKFLHQEGYSDIQQAPNPKFSLTRMFAQWFASEKLERVKVALPQIYPF